MVHIIAPKVPTAYPKTANKTPTGARAGLNALATIGAEGTTNSGLTSNSNIEKWSFYDFCYYK